MERSKLIYSTIRLTDFFVHALWVNVVPVQFHIPVGGENPDTGLLKQFIEQNFRGSTLKDEHQGYVHYQLTDRSKTWANLFGCMEKAKQEYNIEDYSISQTTLEQVFLNFTRSQREVED